MAGGDAVITMTATSEVVAVGECDLATSIAVDVLVPASPGQDLDGNGIPDTCETGPADVDGNGLVDVGDLLAVLGAWGTCPAQSVCPEDVDGDGNVDVTDLLAVLADWS